ncbi:hypothetical protein Syun_003157 [Stephania yunnanensis]|uniref:Zinc-ribbon 15 domain-containing protein n=1 Tax=Stephania yunnanensis TaxID=152371 RepID=A0AAP0L3A2_9MAGN
MFFFFFGGLERQVRQVLKPGSGPCIFCGSRADLVHYENVLKVFFVPVWRWPAKDPLMHCTNCAAFFPPHSAAAATADTTPTTLLDDALRCPNCSRVVDSEFRFCPFCGLSL